MASIYCTADLIGTQSGGGLATQQEQLALSEIDTVLSFDGNILGRHADPFAADVIAEKVIAELFRTKHQFKFAHFYAGCFSRTVKLLRDHDVVVTYTAAAHDITLSREEFASLGVPYNFPHITDPALWERYISGYKLADCVICPSRASFDIMRKFGCARVAVVPHGCNLPASEKALPKQFCVGYLGQVGPDKGLQYLFQAWKHAQLRDSRLILAGRDSTAMLPLVRSVGGGNVEFKGWVDSPSELYDQCSVYCQPSVTEGFGIEVLEALAHGRPVIVSKGAGAADVVEDGVTGYVVPIRDPKALTERILRLHDDPSLLQGIAGKTREAALRYNWASIRKQYQEVWKKVEAEVKPRQ